ncbi:hypothetical protein FB451DRAFT_264067 [Mycena latifolia]|nr:hypothetical protein FB451DRAFT_264067 [Mycena latifolia]
MSMSFLLCILTVPFNGILVRYRASYHPKASVEDGSVPSPPTFVGMAKRVWRLQGVEGLTKGLMPTTVGILLFSFLFSWVGRVYLSPSPCQSRWGLYPSRISSLISTLFYTIIMVTTYRAITTPRKLDPLNAREALHILFSAHERKRPWAIYQIPGLLPAILANLAFSTFVLEPLRPIIFPLRNVSALETVVRDVIFVLVALLATVVTAPLEVIVTRLALQRNYGGLAFDDGLEVEVPVAPVAQSTLVAVSPILVPVASNPEAQAPETSDITEPLSEKATYPVDKTVTPQPVEAAEAPAGADLERGPITVVSDDTVVHLRSENAPYLGLIDCGKKIIAEEGWTVLYRMWFLTFLGNFI